VVWEKPRNGRKVCPAHVMGLASGSKSFPNNRKALFGARGGTGIGPQSFRMNAMFYPAMQTSGRRAGGLESFVSPRKADRQGSADLPPCFFE